MSDTHNTFSFLSAGRIVFGTGSASSIGAEALQLGSRALLVCGATPTRAEKLLERSSLSFEAYAIEGEPTVADIEDGVRLAKKHQCDMVISIGGGSAIDAGKAISALLTNTGEIYEYLEVIGRGQPLQCDTAPFIAVPTTAGTGAEVTKNAVIRATDERVKVSMRSNFMLPNLAIIDPALTYRVPREVTASTGLDALTQVIEPFVAQKANPLTDSLCREGIRRAARSLRAAFDNGQDASAREDMALASLLGGICLANAGLGAVHGFAGPMGGMFPIPHGVICGRLLPLVFAANIRNAGEKPLLQHKLEEIATLLTGHADANIADGVNWLNDLCAHLGIQGFSHYGVTEDDLPTVVASAQKASSMKGNPVLLTDDQLTEILRLAL